jgi:2-hydroxy-3-keto-5-methylthiopentenyl-1-phosphate phosphatase
VFAKDGLARWCALNGVRFTPFRGLADVQDALLGTQG